MPEQDLIAVLRKMQEEITNECDIIIRAGRIPSREYVRRAEAIDTLLARLAEAETELKVLRPKAQLIDDYEKTVVHLGGKLAEAEEDALAFRWWFEDSIEPGCVLFRIKSHQDQEDGTWSFRGYAIPKPKMFDFEYLPEIPEREDYMEDDPDPATDVCETEADVIRDLYRQHKGADHE